MKKGRIMLEVFSTSRAVRSFYNTFVQKNTLLPKAITIQELEQKAILVPNLTLVDEDTKVLLMREASKFASFELLHIEREFLVFLKNSSYLFRFFEELSFEKVSIEELLCADTYAHYAEHLEVLQKLLKAYKEQLLKHGFYDKITLPSCYELNENYIRSLSGIKIHLEGFLSQFEVELLTKIARLIPLHVRLSITPYNQKMLNLFQTLGFELYTNKYYELDLSAKKVLHVSDLGGIGALSEVYGFTNRLSQIAFAQSSIQKFVQEGLKPEEIVIVLPDEQFADMLHSFDKLNNLNFAMGISLKQSQFYKHLGAIEKALRYDAIEDKLRLERMGFEEAFLLTCKELWNQKVTPNQAFEVFDKLLMMDAKEAGEPIFGELFFRFRHFLQKSEALRFEQVVKLFQNRISASSKDDVRGGKVTVLGLLETRGVAYKGVIILDFNDDFVPKRSQKDLFLSSTVRAHAKLPTKKDRENLQRYYYHQLFVKASKIAISYVKNETSMPSRFLDELGAVESKMSDEKRFYPLLFDVHDAHGRYDVEIIEGSYDLASTPLSATKLKTLLTCKRQFYFRYIAMLKDAKMPTTKIDESDVGRYLHKALEMAYDESLSFDKDALYAKIAHFLKVENSHEVWSYFADLWMERLKPFIANEVQRYDEGFRIAHKEIALKAPFQGYVLEGQIDRIDARGDKFFVIDYKSGKIPIIKENALAECVDFQLEFYYLLAQQLGDVEALFYYDLKEGVLIEESFFEEKMAMLGAILEEFKKPVSGFEKCESLKPCGYCPYLLLCGREDQV